jgi:hypothetical protein
MPETLDLRQQPAAADEQPVLADSSGRRARVLRRLAGLAATVCFLWLLGLVLAGLEVTPVHRASLGHHFLNREQPKQGLRR